MISNDYSLISVHGMGISGRVYNEGEARVPFLQITVHTPADCGKYQIRVMVSEPIRRQAGPAAAGKKEM